MVFCNMVTKTYINKLKESHNPYFNRWFSAISFIDEKNIQKCSHNPYFNRWFSAIIL